MPPGAAESGCLPDIRMRLTLLPLLGPLHLRYPALNAFTVRDVLVETGASAVAVTALAEGQTRQPDWQDTFETALPLAVIPWLQEHGPQPLLVGEPSSDPQAEADFRRFVQEMPGLQEQLMRHSQLERQLASLLDSNLTLQQLQNEVLPLIREVEKALKQAAGDGPANNWRYARAEVMAERIMASSLDDGLMAVLVSLQELPALEEALQARGGQLLELPDRVTISAEARERTLLDQAMLISEPDNTAALLQALEQLNSAEAGYARSNLLLAQGLDQEAAALLERVSHGDFSQPYFLPGFLLARLGQLRDLTGKRTEAVKAYRAVLALDWAPQEAVEAAQAGIAAPFTRPVEAG